MGPAVLVGIIIIPRSLLALVVSEYAKVPFLYPGHYLAMHTVVA